jgi:hypothetical protein
LLWERARLSDGSSFFLLLLPQTRSFHGGNAAENLGGANLELEEEMKFLFQFPCCACFCFCRSPQQQQKQQQNQKQKSSGVPKMIPYTMDEDRSISSFNGVAQGNGDGGSSISISSYGGKAHLQPEPLLPLYYSKQNQHSPSAGAGGYGDLLPPSSPIITTTTTTTSINEELYVVASAGNGDAASIDPADDDGDGDGDGGDGEDDDARLPDQ